MRRTRKAQLPEKTDDRLQIFSKGTLECPIKDEKKGVKQRNGLIDIIMGAVSNVSDVVKDKAPEKAEDG
ncbi:hypothetical protein Tco_1038773, partial [Tanacetum coccineum]